MIYEIVKLNKLCEIKGGKRLPKDNDFSSEGYPYIRARDIKAGKITFDKPVYISEEVRNAIKSYTVDVDTVCITIVGANVGDAGIVPSFLDKANLTENAAKLVNLKGILPFYLNYYLQTDGVKEQLRIFSTGSAQEKLALYKLGLLDVILPKIESQKKIAAILSTYDDLIENNKKRIQLLENMAEELYKEWFVRFRFPNWQNTEFEKGIPKGWGNAKLGDICYITMGQAPKSEFYNEIGDGLPFHQGVGTFGERYPKTETYCSGNGRIANSGDILFSVRAPVGRLNFADQKMIIGRGLSAIHSKTNNQDYLYCLLKSKFSKEDVIGNGSIFNSVTKDELSNFEFLLPDKTILQKFDELVSSINQEINVLFNQISNLNRQKNSLLPRLISGKLSVQNLNIQYPPSMQ